MTHFKFFFKLVKSKWHSFAIYIGIFFAVFALMLQFNQPISQMYQAYACDIAVIDHDQSEASALFKDYLAKDNQLIAYQDREAIDDALFLRMIHFGVVIEPGFLEDPSKISLIYDPGIASAGARGQVMIEEYLKLMRSFRQLSPQLTIPEWHEKTVQMLDTENQVMMLSDTKMLNDLSMTEIYFNILGYMLMGLLIKVVGECVVMMFGRLVYLRQQCSPAKPHQVICSIFSACLVLGSMVVIGTCSIIFAFQNQLLALENGWLYLSNAACFGFSIIALSCLVGVMASGHHDVDKDKSVITMCSNVIALTCAFISGLFVPQYLIHPTILKFASLTPSYWYAKVNSLLAQKEIGSLGQMMEVIKAQSIILLFGIVFLALAYLLYKDKKQRQSI